MKKNVSFVNCQLSTVNCQLSILVACFLLHTICCFAQNTLVKSDPDHIFRTGLELLNNEKYAAAQKLFREYRSMTSFLVPGCTPLAYNIEAEYYIAYCALNLFQPDAETLFDNFIEKYPGHSKAMQANYELGKFYFHKKKYDNAIKYFEQTDIKQLSDKEQIERQFKLAYAYLGRKEFDKALEYFSKIKYGYHKYTYAANYYSGYINYLNGNYDKAINELLKAGQNEAYAPLIPLMITNIYYKKSDYDKLISYAESIIFMENGKQKIDKIILLLAEAYYNMGNGKWEMGNGKTKIEIGKWETDKWQKAALYFSRYIEMNKAKFTATATILYRLAYSEYKLNNFDSSAVHFKRLVLNNDSLGQSAAYYLGICYVKTDKKQLALAAFDKARHQTRDTILIGDKVSPSAGLAEASAFQYAKLNYDMEIFAEAINALKYFVNNYPNSSKRSEADALLTEAYLNTNKYDDAIKYIEGLNEKSMRIKIAYQRLLFYFGVESFNNDEYFKAVELFKKSLQYPVDKQLTIAANFWLGETYSVGNKYDKAIIHYLQVFNKTNSPNNEFYIKTMYGIAYAYFNKKGYNKALINFQRYVNQAQLTPKKYYYADAVLRLADCYFVTKSYNEAIKYYDRAIYYKSTNQQIKNQQITESDYAYFQKGVIFGITTNPDLAKENLRVVINKYPGSRYSDDALFQIAQIDFENGNYQDAINGFSKLINIKPNSPFVPYSLLKRGIAFENLQKYDKAIANYKKIIEDHTTHKIAHDAITSLQEALISTGESENFNEYLTKFKQANPNSEALESIEFETAKTLYYSQKYQDAINSFTDYINNYSFVGGRTPSMYYYDAKYYLAGSYYRLGVKIEKNNSSGYGAAYGNALTYYRDVIEDNKSNYVNRSIYRVAGLEYKNHSFINAIKYYEQLLIKASNKKQQFNAWTGLMLCYYELSKFDKVNIYANEILSRGNASINARNKAMLYLGKSAYENGDHIKAMDEFVNTLNIATDANGAEAQYLLAELLFKDAKYSNSLETLFDLNINFANYTEWVDKAFLLIADNYIAQNDLFQAKATLKSIIEKSTSKETVEAAKVKLGNIEE